MWQTIAPPTSSNKPVNYYDSGVVDFLPSHTVVRNLSQSRFLDSQIVSKSEMDSVRVLVLWVSLVRCSAEICIRLLVNDEETRATQRIPGRLWLWNSRNQIFEELEALTMNDTALCSVSSITNLRGRILIAATDFMNPYVMKNKNGIGVTGFIGDAWNILQDTLKFKTIYRRPGPTVKQTLMNGEAHALLAVTAIYSYTSGYYTYSTPITTNSYSLFVQSEGTIISTWWYAKIFSRGLWFTAFIFLLSITGIVMITYYVKRLVYTNYIECDGEMSSITFNLLFVFGGITGQGFQKLPFSWSLRLIVLTCLIMGMLLSCGFSSTLTSYLAIRGTSLPLSSLEEVVQKRTHSLCVRNDSSAYIHFTINGSPYDDLKPEWKDLVNKGCPDMKDSSTLGSKLCQPNYVYLEAPDVFLPIYRQVQHECRIVKTPSAYWSLRLAFLHARTSRYKGILDLYLMRLRSAGLLKYLERKWINIQVHSSDYYQWNALQPVEYAHIHIATCGLLFMMMISVIICVLENISYELHQRCKIESSYFDEQSKRSIGSRIKSRNVRCKKKSCRRQNVTLNRQILNTMIRSKGH